MTPAPPRAAFEPDLVLLLHADPTDAVTRALIDGRAQLGWPLLAVAARQLLDDVRFGVDGWTIAGRRIDPRRTALVNRLPVTDRLQPDADTPGAAIARQAVWTRLRTELARFRYASSLPTATSIGGCFGSLLDQWQDLPRLVPGLRVPEHSAASVPRALQGAVFSVNRWTPYSLGQPLDPLARTAPGAGGPLPPAVRLDYVRPAGHLVHLAQIGDTMFFPNAPPTMTPAQQQAMVGVARALAAVSPIRIWEHAFFLGDGAPILYSSFPVPVLSGGHPTYPELVQQGLRNDIQK